MDAILSQKAVSFTNRTKHGTLFKCSAAVPIKIEYAVISGRFSAFFWQMDPARLFKARLRNLSEIKVLDKISDSQRAEIADMIEHQKCPEPIEMHIQNQNNTAQRAMIFFSQYNTYVSREENGDLIVKISYYRFDEPEILNHIISFGKYIQVVSPAEIVEKIKDKLMRF